VTAKEATVYEAATGRIVYTTTVNIEDLADLALLPGHAAVPGRFAADDYYIEDGIPIGRHDLSRTLTKTDIAADGVDEALIEGLPAGTEVTVDTRLPITVDDGVFAFTTDLPGEYRLTLSHPQSLIEEVIVNAT
jgi:hypothetical protein